MGSIKTATRFGSLAWSKGDDISTSILAGGMLDGTVNLWKPSSLLNGANSASEDALLASVQKHKGGVSAMKFNPHSDSNNLLATGGAGGQVWMMDIAGSAVNVYSPNGDDNAGCNLGGEVTQVAWNSQVSHILATSSANGTVCVWDLRQKKPWCELRVEANCSVSDMAWNPTQGLHMMTASEGSGGLKLWDLRASTSMPLTTLEGGHSGGVLSMDWCPHDDTLLVSCGNDNRTLLWDLYALRPIAEIPNDESSNGAAANNQMQNQQQQQQPNDFYGGGLGTSQQKRYDVSWSPIRRGVVSTCSFDRKVQAHSVIGLATKCGRPPKWMSPSSGVSCGFGGTVVSINNSESSSQRIVTIDNVVEHPELVSVSEKFESEFVAGSTDCIAYCHEMATRATDKYETQVWSFMQIMFETNAREELLSYLGFDPDKIHKTAMEFEEKVSDNGSSSKLPTPPPPPGSEGDVTSTSSTIMSKSAEKAVKDALLVGNFEAAVECCFRSGNLADALVLASCGGADLWQKTQAEYFARESKRRPFLSLVSAVIHDQLTDLVAMSDPKKWKETLAVLSTYGKSEEFPILCAALGDRLEGAGDSANASLCYMCALNLGQAVKYWKFTLQKANESFEGNGTTDLLSMQDFIEKVTVFTQALDSNQVQLDDDVANLFADYSKALANQGLPVAASKYLKGCDTQECKELRDRIYRGRMGRFCPDLMASPPDFPFEFTNVGVARDLQGITVKQSGGQSEVQQQVQVQEQQFATQQDVNNNNGQAANQMQQQPQQMQHQTQQQVQQSPQLQPTQSEANPTPSLLPGWVAVQDPGSGQTYYANQSTGESSWEAPYAPVPQPTAAPMQQQQPDVTQAAAPSFGGQQQPSVNGTTSSSSARSSSTSQKIASKYGDGFVTSASNPQLAEQYGNVGTSNPYTNADRPGTAAAAVGQQKKAPVSGTLDPNSMPALSQEYVYLQDGLMAIVERLTASATSTMEKKQAAEAQKAVAVFIKTLARGGVDAEIANLVGNVLSSLQNRDYASASSVVTGLVSNEWKDHKDWLKGMKFMVQMCTKKQL